MMRKIKVCDNQEISRGPRNVSRAIYRYSGDVFPNSQVFMVNNATFPMTKQLPAWDIVVTTGIKPRS